MYYIIGAGGHAKVVVEILESRGNFINAVFDSNPLVENLFDFTVTRTLPASIDKDVHSVLVCIGNNSLRKKVVESVSYGYGQAIHPNSSISSRSDIGEGTVVMAGACINSGTTIGAHCIINTNASVDHDCYIGDYVHISPNAALAGNVNISEGAHIGIGACIIQGIKIGKWATVGAGAVVIADIPNYAVVVGNPGRIIKYNHEI